MSVKTLIKQIFWWTIRTPFFGKVRTRLCHTRFYLIEGKTKGKNCDLSILVFANENIGNYISDLAYSEKTQIKALGRTTYHKIHSIIADTKPDIVLADIDGIFSEFFSKKFLILPYVISTLDISAPWEIIYARMRRIRRRNIREVEGLSYNYEVTSEPDKLYYFYHQMYLPFISKRPAKVSGFTPIASAKEMFSRGGLLLVKSNGECISGILYHLVNGTLHCALLAYDEGIEGQAALYFLIKWAKEKGHTEIYYGTTTPFMNDGLFLYKRSWGMRVTNNLKRMLALRFCNFGKAVQDFLFDNPFIFTDFKGLIGLMLLDPKDVDQHSLYRKYYTPGLDRLMILYLTKNANAPQMSTSEDSPAPTFSAINSLIKLALEENFNTYLLDFSKQR